MRKSNRARGHATHRAIRSLWCGSEFHSDLPASGPAPSGWWTLWERLFAGLGASNWRTGSDLTDIWRQAEVFCGSNTGRHHLYARVVLWRLDAILMVDGGRWTPARCSSSHHGPPSAVCSSAKASACSGVGFPATAALRLLNISWL